MKSHCTYKCFNRSKTQSELGDQTYLKSNEMETERKQRKNRDRRLCHRMICRTEDRLTKDQDERKDKKKKEPKGKRWRKMTNTK